MSYFGQFNGQYAGAWWGYGLEQELTGGGPAVDYRWFKAPKRKVNKAIDIISEVLAEFAEKPNNPVLEKAAYKEVKLLERKYEFVAPVVQDIVPHDRDFITFEQMQAIRHALTMEYLRLKLLMDDEEVILALYTN